MTDFFAFWLPLQCQDSHLKLFHFAIVVWALWTMRNKITIDQKFSISPPDVLHKIDFFSQKWGVLLSEKERLNLENSRSRVMSWA